MPLNLVQVLGVDKRAERCSQRATPALPVRDYAIRCRKKLLEAIHRTDERWRRALR